MVKKSHPPCLLQRISIFSHFLSEFSLSGKLSESFAVQSKKCTNKHLPGKSPISGQSTPMVKRLYGHKNYVDMADSY